MEKILKKVLKKEVILYIVFGVITSMTNLGSFYIMNTLLGWDKNLANFIAIVLAVLVAYITNKDLVFHSKAVYIKEKVSEFFKFIAGRAFTMLIEFLGGMLLFQLPIPEIISKLIISVVVIILNFFISKYFTFKSDKTNKQED